jgi:hypothetical protein
MSLTGRYSDGKREILALGTGNVMGFDGAIQSAVADFEGNVV